LHDADGGKDIARRAAELCGGAFILFLYGLAALRRNSASAEATRGQ
jgi:hypothetical protein